MAWTNTMSGGCVSITIRCPFMGRETSSVFKVHIPVTHWLMKLWRHRETLLICCDVVTIYAAFAISYYLRFYLEIFTLSKVPIPSAQPYVGAATLVSVLWIVLIWSRGEYDEGLAGATSHGLNVQPLITSGLYAIGGLMVVSFMMRDDLLLS